jgi:hypothetical protein
LWIADKFFEKHFSDYTKKETGKEQEIFQGEGIEKVVSNFLM